MIDDYYLKNRDKLNILIAEDEQEIADLLVELLSQDDRNISIVHDGQQAIEILKKKPFDLLITDLMMPKIDGMKVLHIAKRLYPQILIIIITGYASLETAIQAVKEGAYDYLRKPFKLEELKISVDNACERIYLMKENRLLIKQLREAYKKDEKSLTKKHISKDNLNIPVELFSYLTDIPNYFLPPKINAKFALTEIERLGMLKQQGLITDREFSFLKQKLLEQMS